TLHPLHPQLPANIPTPHHLSAVIHNSAQAIPLYPTQFFYIPTHQIPTHQQQFHPYKKLLQTIHPKPVVLPTLHIPTDKHLP
ncbi:putative PEP-binding protein, partial [Staphylococcus epidermidis]|uniref:putative PEP-binding protein n=1 Tax=Staphylococcus epidermidis TaxID=1282 RepID=UPI0028CB4F01